MFFDAIRQGDAAQVSPGLGLACFFGHTEIAQRLLDKGADPNLASGNTLRVAPLHSAIAANSPAIVELLLSRGARTDIEDASGYTPVTSAAAHGNPAIIKLLHV